MEEGIVRKMRESVRPTETMEWRVSNMEKHYQLRRLSSIDGQTYFDTEEGKLIITDPVKGSIELSAGEITYKDINGNISRQESGILSEWYGPDGVKRKKEGWQ